MTPIQSLSPREQVFVNDAARALIACEMNSIAALTRVHSEAARDILRAYRPEAIVAQYDTNHD